MPRKLENPHVEVFDFDTMEDTETLISRNKPPRVKSVTTKKMKKSAHWPVSSGKTKLKTGRDRWMAAVKKQQTLSMCNGRFIESPQHKTPIDYWVDTLRKTGTGMSTESTGMNTLTALKKTNELNFAYLSTSHYMRQMMGTEKPKRMFEDPSAKTATGTPAYKSQEEYYDQILELKKHISSLSQDNLSMKAKLRRLEEDNIKKEKEIDGLLHPEKNEEIRRTIGDRKPDSGAVIHSLKQKILKLEMQMRDKEASYIKLASDLKTTKVDEMKIQIEVLYQEVFRLQNSHSTVTDKARPHTENTAKVKALNETVIRLSKSNEQLQTENKSLKEDLDKALAEGEETLSVKRDFEDMNRKQLLDALTLAERRAERAERKVNVENASITSLDSRWGEIKGKIILQGTLEERLHQLDRRETDLLEEIDRLKLRIKRMSTERSKKKFEYLSREPGEDSKGNNLFQKRAATSIQRQWRQHRERRKEEEEMTKANKFRENQAAKAIQKRWRQHRHEEEENEEAAFVIQSALRGHQRRRQELLRHIDDYDNEQYSTGDDDAVYTIQSSLKGHKSRREQLRRMRLDSAGDDGDSDSYNGYDSGRASAVMRPSSAQARGSFVKRKTTYASYGSQASADDDNDIMF